MLQSLSFREAVVTWPHSAYGGKWLGWRHIVCSGSCAMGRKKCSGDSSIRANGMRARAQRLTYTRGGRMTLGREGNRNVQNFPSFGRGFDSHRPLHNSPRFNLPYTTKLPESTRA